MLFSLLYLYVFVFFFYFFYQLKKGLLKSSTMVVDLFMSGFPSVISVIDSDKLIFIFTYLPSLPVCKNLPSSSFPCPLCRCFPHQLWLWFTMLDWSGTRMLSLACFGSSSPGWTTFHLYVCIPQPAPPLNSHTRLFHCLNTSSPCSGSVTPQ